MRIRHGGWLIGGALVVVACSSGGETEPLPLETAPLVTAAPTTDAAVPSTDRGEAADVTVVDETTTTAVPEPTATATDDPVGPVEVFREAAAAFNEVELNPEDESIRPAAYELMTERFRADRSFEVVTGDPQFLNPHEELALLSEAELSEDGANATLWYCVRLVERSPDSADPVSSVMQATMQLVDDEWRWADRGVIASSPQAQGCPPDLDLEAVVDAETSAEVEEAALGFFENFLAAQKSPGDEEAVARFTAGLTGVVLEGFGQFVQSLASADQVLAVDSSLPVAPRLVSTPVERSDGGIFVVACEPLSSRIEQSGATQTDLFLRSTTVLGMLFVREDAGLLLSETTTVSDLAGEARCEPSF